MIGLGLGSSPITTSRVFDSTQCLQLDGNSDYVILPDPVGDLRASYNAGTISAWVDIQDNDGASSQNIVRIADDSTNNGMTLQFHRGNTEFRAIYRLEANYKEATYNEASFSLADYFAQGWIHLAMTWQSDGAGTGAVKIYKNGALQETVAQDKNKQEGDILDIAHIGAGDDGASAFTDGFIDQVAIYTITLDADAIAAIYNGGNMRDLTMTTTNYNAVSNLAGYYRFEGNALDSSKNKNHGTLVGTAGFSFTQP